jgi:hypothetical protein
VSVSQWRKKKELAGLTFTQETSLKELEGSMRNLTAADFAKVRPGVDTSAVRSA